MLDKEEDLNIYLHPKYWKHKYVNFMQFMSWV
jgi:hypothetical protein